VLVDPDDEDGFTAALVRAATPGAEHDRLVAAGLARAAGFTWRKAAEAVDRHLGGLLA
jgi:hypothetical protein